ncbi:MAG: regulator of CtrA degradation [Hyphomicrobiales bacterium]|nr:MAG: regulator of CtrA degradation [Hyphomicrobiales bacterium]
MTQKSKSTDSVQAIAIASRLAETEGFLSLFNHGMLLIEQTAEYLDGPGRDESKALSRVGSIAYASESMRLTTRLMQIASWLLLQRAVNEGEMSATDGKAEKAKVRLGGMQPSMSGSGWDELPEPLKDMIERSQRLEERVRHLDVGLGGQSFAESMNSQSEEKSAPSALVDQMARLSAAFPGTNTTQ